MPTHYHPHPAYRHHGCCGCVSPVLFSVAPWRPSSSPPQLPGLPFHRLGRPVVLPSTPGCCASVLRLPHHSAAVPTGLCVFRSCSCSLFLLFISLSPLLFSSYRIPHLSPFLFTSPPHFSSVANPVAIPVMRHWDPFSSETAVSQS